MGGRGANLNVGTYLGWGNERRTGEYEVIHSDGNTKFLVQKKWHADFYTDILEHRRSRICHAEHSGQDFRDHSIWRRS